MDKIFSDRTGDPLLFLSNDKSDLDSFLLSGGDMDRISNEDLQVHVNDDSLDFNILEGGGHLGDVNWLHNASLAALTHFDNEDTSDGSTMISVNPQSVIPMQINQPSKPDNLMSSENANSAAMRLHANCSNLIGGDSPEEKKSTSTSSAPSLISQDHPSIRILSVASAIDAVNSPTKPTNYIITSSSAHSPLKSQTYVLNTTNGVLTPEQNISTISYRSGIAPNATGNLVLASPQKIQTLSTDKNGRVLLKAGLSPSQASPVLLGHLQTGVQVPPQGFQNAQVLTNNMVSSTHSDTPIVSSTTNCGEDRPFPKPVFSYSCLIALALKNSLNGSLPVSEIYNFMCENFPYFKTAPDGWKNSVRHNLSLNKCFAKVDNPKMNQGAKKGCLWALNPAKVAKMEEEISKWGKKDPVGLLTSMAFPENLEAIEKGEAGLHFTKKKSPVAVTPIKAETTSVKPEYSPVVKPEFHPIKIESNQTYPSIPIHTLPPRVTTPVKSRQHQLEHHAPQARHHPYSPTVHRNRSQPSSPMPHSIIDIYNSPMKASSTADPSTKALSISDIHSSLSHQALTEIVLQNGMWETEDLENEIDLDIICNSPSSGHLLLPIQSPLHPSSSPNTLYNSGYCSPSIQSPYPASIVQVHRQSPQVVQRQSPLSHVVQRQSPLSHVVQRQSPLSHVVQIQSPHLVQSPLPQNSPTPNTVRNNLFGVGTPTRRSLYT